MRPLSPSPLTCGTRQRLLIPDDAFVTDDNSARSSSSPPRHRVAYSGVSILAPCSKEFQKSLNGLNRRDEEDTSAENKLTLPVIRIMSTNHVDRDGSHGKTRTSCWDDSATSANSSSSDDINKSWTSLSGVGTLATLQPKNVQRGSRTKCDNSDCESCDDSMSVRSDSFMMCRKSPSVCRKQRGRKKVDSAATADGDETGRLSRKDEGTRHARDRITRSILEPPASNPRSRGLSHLSRPQQEKDNSFLQSICRSKSAHTSPHRERRDNSKLSSANGTNSAPTSPHGSPLLNRASNAKRASEIPKWQRPFNLSTSPSSDNLTSQSLNPFLTKLDTTSATGRHPPTCVHMGRGSRVYKDACRLSDLSLESVPKPSHTVVNLQDEFKRLRACRYLRCHSDGKESDEDI